VMMVGADPEGSLYSGSAIKPYKVEGIGEDFIPGTIDLKLIDRIVQVNDRDSFLMARRITREEAIKLVKEKKAVYVDVRGKDQYDQGHIKGAINIPLGDILTRLREIPPKTFIITYCA